jgi:hypothetical protein
MSEIKKNCTAVFRGDKFTSEVDSNLAWLTNALNENKWLVFDSKEKEQDLVFINLEFVRKVDVKLFDKHPMTDMGS